MQILKIWLEWKEFLKQIRDFDKYKTEIYDSFLREKKEFEEMKVKTNQDLEKWRERIREREDWAEKREIKVEEDSKNLHLLIRHNLYGDPLNTKVPEEPSEDEGFFGEVNTLSKNKTLQTIINQLKKEFLEFIAYQAESLDWINHNRARIDGLQILQERLEQMGAEKEQYDARRNKEDAGGERETEKRE